MSKLDLSPEGLEKLASTRVGPDPIRSIPTRDGWIMQAQAVLRALAIERRNAFLAGALAMREAAASMAASLEEEARIGAITAYNSDESGFKGIGHTMRKHAFARAKEAIRAIDPASLTEKPALKGEK